MMGSRSLHSMRLLPTFAIAVTVSVAAGIFSGCKESNPVGMGDVDVSRTPTMLTRNVETLISDSGVTRFRIVTPIWYVYDEVDEPYWDFPEGLNLDKYDNFFRKEATVVADSAVYFKNKQIWRLDGNVNITNVMNEKFLTNQLFWDQRQHKLYSDSFIHIERPDKVLEGYGFDSNEQLTRYTIRNVSGIFPANAFRSDDRGAANDDDGGESDSDEVDNDSINTQN
ncbi:MAG: LPS export ABC transporter periplasmic protein LptC [Bacteroides sp.]|nr:LPS export ABC transporter periplasmic protein LptC [Bacteroides sp.]